MAGCTLYIFIQTNFSLSTLRCPCSEIYLYAFHCTFILLRKPQGLWSSTFMDKKLLHMCNKWIRYRLHVHFITISILNHHILKDSSVPGPGWRHLHFSQWVNIYLCTGNIFFIIAPSSLVVVVNLAFSFLTKDYKMFTSMGPAVFYWPCRRRRKYSILSLSTIRKKKKMFVD